MKIELILLGVIGIVFLVDFMMNSRKKPSIDNIVNQIEGGAAVETSSTRNYILDRKKNISLFIVLVPLFKIIVNYLIYPQRRLRPGRIIIRNDGGVPSKKSGEKFSFSDHIDYVFEWDLWLFIPVILIMLFIAWFFNNKIKAR
tara:strand:- start:4510 stop:4938 length:429 start_codon:yes stop_codon:yes gene_type:complete